MEVTTMLLGSSPISLFSRKESEVIVSMRYSMLYMLMSSSPSISVCLVSYLPHQGGALPSPMSDEFRPNSLLNFLSLLLSPQSDAAQLDLAEGRPTTATLQFVHVVNSRVSYHTNL